MNIEKNKYINIKSTEWRVILSYYIFCKIPVGHPVYIIMYDNDALMAITIIRSA